MFTLTEVGTPRFDRNRPPLRNPVQHIVRFEGERCERWLRREERKRLLSALNRHEDQASANAVWLIVVFLRLRRDESGFVCSMCAL
jgi:hypothetical protein